MSAQLEQGLGEYLPGTTSPNSADPSAPRGSREEIQDRDDQISLESHTIAAETIRTADDVKSPPPPYSAGDLPSYEEAIRWSKSKNDTDNSNNAT